MKFSRTLLVTALLGTVFNSSAIAGESYKIDPAHSTIAFQVRHLLGTAKGKFTKFSGTIQFDHERPEASSVSVAIQTASIDTGIAKRDEHLRGADFFNVQKFPEITFKSRQVKKTGANTGEIIGDLTMRGVTRPITLQVELIGSVEQLPKERTTKWRVRTAPIKRSEFGLVWSKSVEAVSMISDEVRIEIEIAAVKSE